MGGIINNIAFIHIPKTAGTSIRHALRLRPGHEIWTAYPNRKRFAIVRNPYERYASAYFYLKNKAVNKRDIEAAERLKPDINKNTKYLRQQMDIVHFQPQYQWIYSGEMQADWYKLEDLDWKGICAKYGFKYTKLRNDKVNNYSYQLTEETIKILNNIYRLDFELFNYTKL